MARRFFYVAAGMLMLALSYHFGFSTASAQAGGQFVSITGTNYAGSGYAIVALTSTGEVYGSNIYASSWDFLGQISAGGPVPAQRESWGQVKSRYAPNRVAKPGAVGR